MLGLGLGLGSIEALALECEALALGGLALHANALLTMYCRSNYFMHVA